MELKGIAPIIATPFTNSGEVDEDSLKNLLHVLIKMGCHALTLFGIAGEYYKLSDGESRRMTRIVADECRAGGVPSIVSVTQHATELAVRRAREAEEAGADCLMLLPPFFLKPGAADICRHIREVGQAVKIPVMVQYAPEQTGVAIDPSVFAQLSREAENIGYYKIECKPVGGYITRLLEQTGRSVTVFVGNAGYQLPEAFDRGAVGAMPGCSMADVYLKIYDSYFSGRREEAVRIHDALLPMLNHIRQNVEMIIAFEKRILQRRGIIQTAYCRRPTFTPDAVMEKLFDEYYEKLRPYMDREVGTGGPA